MSDKIYDSNTGFYHFSDYVDESYLDLTSRDPKDIIPYQMTFLKDTLRGLMPSELVVFAADSGCGKTTLANIMAYQVSAMGKKVYGFFLEGDRYEPVNRQRYRLFVRYLKKHGLMSELFVVYRDFLMNDFGDKERTQKIHKILSVLDKQLQRVHQNLKIYSREDSLDIDRFEAHFDMIKDEADLIILDHLQYFHYHQQTEYRAISEIMTRIKKKQDKHRVPIILISHLRKKASDRSFPDQYELHGSSNISKEADTVIILAPLSPPKEKEEQESYQEQIQSGVYSTGVRIAKARTGFPEKLIGITKFDRNTESYLSEYELVMSLKSGDIVNLNVDEYPKWAKEGHADTPYNPFS